MARRRDDGAEEIVRYKDGLLLNTSTGDIIEAPDAQKFGGRLGLLATRRHGSNEQERGWDQLTTVYDRAVLRLLEAEKIPVVEVRESGLMVARRQNRRRKWDMARLVGLALAEWEAAKAAPSDAERSDTLTELVGALVAIVGASSGLIVGERDKVVAAGGKAADWIGLVESWHETAPFVTTQAILTDAAREVDTVTRVEPE